MHKHISLRVLLVFILTYAGNLVETNVLILKRVELINVIFCEKNYHFNDIYFLALVH